MTEATSGILFSNWPLVLEPEPMIYDGVLFLLQKVGSGI